MGGTAAGQVSGGLLASLRVLDLGGAESDGVGRLFADLGADVLKVEPPGGSSARARTARRGGHAALRSALQNANKRSAVLDPGDAADRHRLIELAGTADIVVDSGNPGTAAAFGTSCAALAERFGHLVALSVTDFGSAGPYASRRATDPVLYAMSTALSRTGPDDGHARAAARRCGVGDSGGAGRLGGTGRLLSPITLRQRRLHRLLTLRGGRCSHSIRRTDRRVRRPSA